MLEWSSGYGRFRALFVRRWLESQCLAYRKVAGVPPRLLLLPMFFGPFRPRLHQGSTEIVSMDRASDLHPANFITRELSVAVWRIEIVVYSSDNAKSGGLLCPKILKINDR